MNIFLYVLTSYLVGCINPAYIISKLNGFDIREKGTGNAGASNITIVMGKKAGIITALSDILKAFVVTLIAGYLFPEIKYVKIISGIFCILGHIFPVFMKFHGGKGLACLGGMILAYNPVIFLILLLIEMTVLFFVGYISVVAPSGAFLFTLIYFFTTRDITGTSLLTAVSVIIFCKHIGNFKRIRKGEETPISFLWKKN